MIEVSDVKKLGPKGWRRDMDDVPLCLFDVQLLFLNTCQKMINGVGWLDDRHGLSVILYDTAPLFVYTDQLLCHCVPTCCNVR